jgi:hypothetical protein
MEATIPSAILRQVRRDLFVENSSKFVDFKAFVSSQRYYVESVGDAVKLRPHIADELKAACAGDCSKFACAAIESLSGIVADAKSPRNAAWFVVRAYYAAFYSAHALLRMFGVLCSNIDGPELLRLKEAAKVTGQEFPKRGFFRVEISKDMSVLTFDPLKNSHEDTWATVVGVLNDLRSGAVTAAAPKASRDAAVEFLSEHIARLTDSQKYKTGNFLSYTRNQVQYRFALQTWHPYGGAKFPPTGSFEELAVSVLQGRFQNLTGQTDLIKFTNCALNFCQFSLDLVDSILSEGNDVSHHLIRGYARVKNMCR